MDLSDIAGALIGPVLSVLLAWAVGERLSAHWTDRQKRRDEARAAASEFNRLYGEFFAIWKLWNYSAAETIEADAQVRRWDLLTRATSAEAGVEALLLKLASERSLGPAELETLGRFRQGYQALRQAIRDSKKLDWRNADHPEYVAFKRLAARAGRLVATVDQGASPKVSEVQAALLTVTANRWEGRWHDVPSFEDGA